MANAAFLLFIFPQAWVLTEPPVAARFGFTLVAVSIFSAILIRVTTEQQKKLHAMAATDPLTGLYNRTLLDETLDQAIERSRRTGTPMTLLAVDLDHFKNINDSMGHDAGDSVLRGVGEFLRNRVRRVDRVFRLGGEEFLALLNDTDLAGGSHIAEELRATVASLELLPGWPITISVGVATLGPKEDSLQWMRRADDNLYRAKVEGWDRIVV